MRERCVMLFFNRNHFDALVLSSLDDRGALMVLLLQSGYSTSTCAILAEAIIAGRYRYVNGGVVIVVQ